MRWLASQPTRVGGSVSRLPDRWFFGMGGLGLFGADRAAALPA